MLKLVKTGSASASAVILGKYLHRWWWSKGHGLHVRPWIWCISVYTGRNPMYTVVIMDKILLIPCKKFKFWTGDFNSSMMGLDTGSRSLNYSNLLLFSYFLQCMKVWLSVMVWNTWSSKILFSFVHEGTVTGPWMQEMTKIHIILWRSWIFTGWVDEWILYCRISHRFYKRWSFKNLRGCRGFLH